MNFLDSNQVHQPQKRHFGFLMPIVLVMFVAALGVAGYFYNQYRMVKNNPDKVAADQVSDVVAKVSKLMVLPGDETPTLATVTEPEKLKDQVFFAHAQKGDKVLVYEKAKKAILYSPTLNKVVEVSPLDTSAAQQDQQKTSVSGSNTTAPEPTTPAGTTTNK